MKKKFVILILVFALGFSVPFYTSRGVDFAYLSKEFGLDTIARLIASRLLSNLGKGVVDSINNLGVEGGKKGPTFVQNWKKFLADSQNIGENQFRSQLSYVIKKGILCDDLKGPLALAFQAANVPEIDIGTSEKYAELKQNTLLPYQTKIKCTIPDEVRTEFKKDFEKGGGWETWKRMIEPQNNLAGALSKSLEEMTKQRIAQADARAKEVVAGQGFRGVGSACQKAKGTYDTVCFSNCMEREDTKGITNEQQLVAAKNTCEKQCTGQTALGKDAQCAFLGKTLTPAKILGEGAAGWLDNNSKWLVTSDELSEVIVAILNAALNKLVNFAADKIGTAVTGENDQSTDVAKERAEATNKGEETRQDLKDIKNNTEETSKNTEGLGDTINNLDQRVDNLENTPLP